jgi:hypothetical protein
MNIDKKLREEKDKKRITKTEQQLRNLMIKRKPIKETRIQIIIIDKYQCFGEKEILKKTR